MVSDLRERALYNALVGCGTYIFALSGQQHVDATRAGEGRPRGLWRGVLAQMLFPHRNLALALFLGCPPQPPLHPSLNPTPLDPSCRRQATWRTC